MKKKLLSLILCFLVGASTFLFSACDDDSSYHSILATSSNAINCGDAVGSGNYKTNSMVVLTATPKNDNTFLAWTKNDLVVSSDAEYSFIASASTAGKYIALFSTSTFDYVLLNGVSYDLMNLTLNNENLTATEIVSWKLKSNTVSTLYKNLASFENQEISNIGSFSSENVDFENKVFFSHLPYFFTLTMVIKYTNNDTQLTSTEQVTTDFMIDLSTLLGTNAVVDGSTTTYEGTRTVTSGTDNTIVTDYNLTLTSSASSFELTAEYHSLSALSSWATDGGNSQQKLTLSFSYPFEID